MSRNALFWARLRIAGLIVGWAGTVVGAPPLNPSRALQKPAPGFASWTITFAEASAAAENGINERVADQPRIHSIHVIKTRSVRQEIVLWESGLKSENWTVGALGLFCDPVSRALSIVESRLSDATQAELSKNDFPLLSWITRETEVRVEKFQGEDCYLYEAHLALMESAPGWLTRDPLDNAKQKLFPEAPRARQRAYLSKKTRLPVAVEIDGRVGNFEWHAAPKEVLIVPPEITSAIRTWNEKSRKLLRVPEAP